MEQTFDTYLSRRPSISLGPATKHPVDSRIDGVNCTFEQWMKNIRAACKTIL